MKYFEDWLFASDKEIGLPAVALAKAGSLAPTWDPQVLEYGCHGRLSAM